MNRGSYYWKCVAFAAVGYLILGLVTLLLWNWLVPTLFNGPEIGFVQSLGLLVLAKILFGGWGGGRWVGRRPIASVLRHAVQRSVIVRDLYVQHVRSIRAKADAVLVIDANRPLADPAPTCT